MGESCSNMDRKQNILFFVLPLLAPQQTLGCIFVPPPTNPPATTTTEAPTTTAPTPAPTTTASTTGSGAAGSRSFVTGLSWSFNQENSPFCAGALIAQSWIITTASCSYADNQKVSSDEVNVILGEETLGQESDYFLVSGVSKIITHPNFSSSSKADNLALWKLKNPVSTETYTRICLPTEDSISTGEAKLVGWRISEVIGSLNESLQETVTSVLSSSECGGGTDLLCTAENTRCQGDVGAPLVQGLKLLGVMSGHGCCSQLQNGQFSNIAKYTSWIQDKVTSNGGESVCIL